MSNENVIKAVIFDFDGTLFDTRKANAQAYSAAFEEAGISFDIFEYEKYYGKKWFDWGPNLAGNKASHIHQRKKELYKDMFKWIEPIEKIIDQWRKIEKGVLKVLVTNASRECVQELLNKFEITFNHEFYGEDYLDEDEMLNDIIEKLNVEPFEILLVDDSENRIKKSEKLGMNVQQVKVKNAG